MHEHPMPQAAGPASGGGAHLSRLKRRAEFLRVAAARRKWAAPGLVLQVADAREPVGGDKRVAPALKVGYTVSRKVGGAVARNRARRRLKAAVQKVMARHARPGLDYVVIGRAATNERDFADLVRDLEQALRRLGAWRLPAEHGLGEPE